MAKLFGSFPLFGEGASFANTKCEPVVQRIRMRDVGFVLQLFFYATGSDPIGFNFSNFLKLAILLQFGFFLLLMWRWILC